MQADRLGTNPKSRVVMVVVMAVVVMGWRLSQRLIDLLLRYMLLACGSRVSLPSAKPSIDSISPQKPQGEADSS